MSLVRNHRLFLVLGPGIVGRDARHFMYGRCYFSQEGFSFKISHLIFSISSYNKRSKTDKVRVSDCLTPSSFTFISPYRNIHMGDTPAHTKGHPRWAMYMFTPGGNTWAALTFHLRAPGMPPPGRQYTIACT